MGYHLTKLGFWSTSFEVVPYYMIVLGFFTFNSGLYGALTIPLGKRATLLVYAILMVFAFLAQIGSIFTALEVRSNIENNKGETGIQKEFPLYDKDSAIRAKWDELHRDLHCCGGYRYGQGYTDWVGKLQSKPKGTVPDSCCQTYSEGCGISVANGNTDSIRAQIFVDGCIGVVLALIELISVILSCAYIAQINRKNYF